MGLEGYVCMMRVRRESSGGLDQMAMMENRGSHSHGGSPKTQETPVPQLARSGPYSHDGEREALSQITITYHNHISQATTSHEHCHHYSALHPVTNTRRHVT